MEIQAISSISALTSVQLGILKQGGIINTADLLFAAPADIARKCRITIQKVDHILDTVCNALAKYPRVLETVEFEGDEKFTTGDERLDEALGGGIRTGMIWDVVGESAAGKTQLALQLSLMVQLPHRLGGLDGSACYLTTTSTLPTSRLLDLRDTHPVLSPSLCSLSDIHTIRASEISILLHVLSNRLPDLMAQLLTQSGRRPVKLFVIDALTELFHTHGKFSKETLYERSRSLTEISTLLHGIASQYQVAIVVLNEVVDSVDRSVGADMGKPDEILYRVQSRLFNQADNVPGGTRKEASLGLVWANQVNARIIMSRTERMRAVDDELAHRKAKRRRLDDPQAPFTQSLTRIRRLNVIFSSVGPPVSLDYIVSHDGIITLPDTVAPENTLPLPSATNRLPLARMIRAVDGISPLDMGVMAGDALLQSSPPTADAEGGAQSAVSEAEEGPQQDDGDEWDEYWREADASDNLYGTDVGSSRN